MADYAIGDVQGCYDSLMGLLDVIQFDDSKDKLWFVGDIVNRGPKSLAVMRFIYNLRNRSHIVLGNHDLHFLARLYLPSIKATKDDTLAELIAAPDAEELASWLRKQAVLIYSESFGMVMCHAGIAPCWTVTEALGYANELEQALTSANYRELLMHLYGNKPDLWSNELRGFDRLRTIFNYFTRMRCCDANGRILLTFNESRGSIPDGFYPWFEVPNRRPIAEHIIFGHWAALAGKSHHPKIHPIDTGCVWGGPLTALRLQDFKQFQFYR